MAPSWAELTKLGVIAVIRTFLTYFLDRDLERADETLGKRPLEPIESTH